MLVALHVADALAGAVALGFGHSGQNGEDQLAHAVAGHIGAEIHHVQADALFLEPAEDGERVEVGAEHAVELGGDDGVARAERRQQRRA